MKRYGELNEKFHAISQDLYGQAGAGAQQGGPQPGADQGFQGGNAGGNNQNGGGAEDIPYEEV